MLFNDAVYITVELDMKHEWDTIRKKEVKVKVKTVLVTSPEGP
jgi:hypothetical protein